MNPDDGGTTKTSRRVHILPDAVARKIAAGEVIDRPHSVVRELLDNALDADPTEISVYLEKGGLSRIRVVDDGSGMSRDDLDICWLPHATSKIATADDLDNLRSLGFRGEALSSVATCARLDIVSALPGGAAHRLEVHGGKLLSLGSYRGAPGTAVDVADLFFNQPARRRFLKSPRGETSACRRVFLEKAAAHPAVTFRLFLDGTMRNFLPAGNRIERLTAAWPDVFQGTSPNTVTGSGPGFTFDAVIARPEMSRKDRRYLQVYANRRRIDEFSLTKALALGFDPFLPGGVFPVAFLFLDVEPHLVDFNIHPAKKEARFRDPSTIRHRVIDEIRAALTDWAYKERPAPTTREVSHGTPFPAAERRPIYRAAEPEANRDAFVDQTRQPRYERGRAVPPPPDTTPRFLGQIMGLFLVAEAGESLYVVDQHAAHERILYDRFRKEKPEAEKLLLPRRLDLDPETSDRMAEKASLLDSLGIRIEKGSDDTWSLTALPSVARGLEAEVAAFIEEGDIDGEGMEKALWADLACKAAVKDGETLDDVSAIRLLSETFDLETPRCPHGRPVWFEVSRRELMDLVGRTV